MLPQLPEEAMMITQSSQRVLFPVLISPSFLLDPSPLDLDSHRLCNGL
jgi:hypothetical protein